MKYIGIVLVVLATVGIVTYGLFSQNQTGDENSVMDKPQNEKMMANEDTMMREDEDKMMQDDDMSMSDDAMMGERYVDFSEDALIAAASGRRVLFFYANWCPTCRPADADLKNNQSQIPNDVTVLRVNYNDTDTDNEEKGLAIKYRVTYQHTFVQIDSQGEEVAKWNGGNSAELVKNVK